MFPGAIKSYQQKLPFSSGGELWRSAGFPLRSGGTGRGPPLHAQNLENLSLPLDNPFIF